jgi:type I restriction enzyme S subunit
MAGYHPYPEYKESGVEWLGETPTAWKRLRADFVVKTNRTQVSPDWLEGKDVIHYSIPNVQEYGAGIVEAGDDIDSAKLLVCEPQLLVSKLNPRKATLCLVEPSDEYPVVASSEFVPIMPGAADAKYTYYVWGSDIITSLLSSQVQSVTRSHQRVNPTDVLKIDWVWPSLSEQQTIARFLDHKTAKIDALIAKKQTLLEKLAEKRTALISHAVTKGLDPNVKMKDSGVEWLGEVPEHWSVIRLRFVVNKIEQGWSPQCENQPADEGEWGVLKVGCVNGENFDASENKALPSDVEPKIQYEIKADDILMSRANTKELLGSAALVNDVRGKLILCDKLYRFISGGEISNKYLVHILRSSLSRFQYEREATGASGSMQNIGQDTVKNLVFALPPIEKQLKIESHLEEVIARIEDAEKLAKEAIEKLKEYRSAMITQAVTGKIDVRNVKIPQATAKGQAA